MRSNVDAVLKRAGTVGDGWLTYFYTPESFTKGWEKVKGFARAAGRDPKNLSSTNQLAVYVGSSRAQTTTTSAMVPLPIHFLAPLIVQVSPSRRAVASSATESEPWVGSVSANREKLFLKQSWRWVSRQHFLD